MLISGLSSFVHSLLSLDGLSRAGVGHSSGICSILRDTQWCALKMCQLLPVAWSYKFPQPIWDFLLEGFKYPQIFTGVSVANLWASAPKHCCCNVTCTHLEHMLSSQNWIWRIGSNTYHSSYNSSNFRACLPVGSYQCKHHAPPHLPNSTL